MTETKKAMTHRWTRGVEQKCLRPGCPWRHRYLPGGPRFGLRRLWSRDGETWASMSPVPKCEGTR